MFGTSPEKIIELGKKKRFNKVMGFKDSKDAEVRAAAATGLGYVDSDDACTQLITMLYDGDDSVKEAVVKALMGMTFASRSVEHIRRMMGSTTDEKLIELCKEAIHKISHPD